METQIEVKHTPTPWVFDKPNEQILGDDAGYYICRRPAEVFQSRWEANAEFIVRAVNEYDGLIAENVVKSAVIGKLTKENEVLLAALKRFMNFNGCYAGGEKMDALDFSMNLANLHKQAREAIAQAEAVQS